MGEVKEQEVGAVSWRKPEVTAQKLARCPNPECHAPHPLARDFWKVMFEDNSVCPNCGGPAGGQTDFRVASAYLNFPFVTKLCFWAATGLRALARKVEP